jgi:hypothetical protein
MGCVTVLFQCGITLQCSTIECSRLQHFVPNSVRSKVKYVHSNNSEIDKILTLKKTGLNTTPLAAQN